MLRVIIFLLIGFCILTPAFAQDKVFNAKSYMLDNGLQVVVVENDRAPVVTHMVWYRVGAADEPRGKSGIAHFLEHLMFKGQSDAKLATLAPGEFSRIVRSLGGEDNAFTSQDYTAYFQSIAADQLETVMRMEAGRMRGIDVPSAEFASESLVILEERSQRTDNDPSALMAEQMNDALFPNHPYGIPVIGWRHEIAGLSWADAKEFYDQFYAPNNAILIVSGAVSGEEVLALAKKTYGLVEKVPAIQERVRTQSPPFIAATRVTLRHERVNEPVFLRKYRVPSYRQNAADSLALQVLENIMSDGQTARLYKSLVAEQKIATGVWLSYSSSAWDDGTVTLSATPSKPDQLDLVEANIDEELRRLIKDGVSESELAQAIKKMQAEAIYARDSVSGPAFIIGYTLVTGSSLDDIENWPRLIATVTKEQIQDVAARYLNPDSPSSTPPVTGILLPAEPIDGGDK